MAAPVAICADSTATTSCSVTRWSLTPDDADAYSSYIVYDEATHPALISEVWFR